MSFFGTAQNNGEDIKPDKEVYSPEQLQMMAEIKSIIQENKRTFFNSLTTKQKKDYEEFEQLKASGVSFEVRRIAYTAFMNTLSEAQHKSRQDGIDKREALKAAFRATLNEEQKEHQDLKKKLWLSKI